MLFQKFFKFALIFTMCMTNLVFGSSPFVSSSSQTIPSSSSTKTLSINKSVKKRGIALYGDEYSVLPIDGIKFSPGYPLAPWANPSVHVAPSPAQVAGAISQAKQASANVLIAQQQVQAAKENVLNQQRIAMEKEATASLLTQKSEAAAAIQRSEAAAAAQAVVLAQQRLAAAKANVAHQQKIAALKEANAAQALQNSARAAAAEIQRTEHEASKYANIHRTGAAASFHHLTATKDAAVAPLTSGSNHIPNLSVLNFENGGGMNSVPSVWVPNSIASISSIEAGKSAHVPW
ncbi:uncharacterized protein LOC129608097 [Condylostylus longicornis]|uniref:uncharacterized protein LOC129608097 n=1 Tax=Condylostylus longicornis TaxID=2530218 RepID=UPI00244DB664|nr:uncharacterized protein LOC129608097 [Condylostylus longicornis]